jgi:hypothetical protein
MTKKKVLMVLGPFVALAVTGIFYIAKPAKVQLSTITSVDTPALQIACLSQLNIAGNAALLRIDGFRWHEVVLSGYVHTGSMRSFMLSHGIPADRLSDLALIEVSSVEEQYGMYKIVPKAECHGFYRVFSGERPGIRYIWIYYCPESERFAVRLRLH